MEDSRTFFDPRNLARLSGLQLRARRIVEGYITGAHRSPYRGFSIEFAEHREYTPGDDLRYLDWKAFGRTDRYYLKRFEDETNLIAYLALDTSESMTYRSDQAAMSKLDYARCLVAAVAWLTLNQQDAAALATFDSEVRHYVRPATTASQIKQMLHVLETADPAPRTALGPVFHDLSERFKRRGVVLIVSDMFDDPRALLAGLKHLRHRRHDVTVLQVLDPAEIDFPFRQTTLFEGMEQGPKVLTDVRQLRGAYRRELDRFLKELEGNCRFHEMDYVLARTDQPFDVVLSRYLSARLKRVS